jgi:hypothetical protein
MYLLSYSNVFCERLLTILNEKGMNLTILSLTFGSLPKSVSLKKLSATLNKASYGQA